MWNAASMAETIRYGYLRDYGLNVLSQDVKVAWGYSSIVFLEHICSYASCILNYNIAFVNFER